jgi:hypothetical protein
MKGVCEMQQEEKAFVVEKLQDGPAEPDNYVLYANAAGAKGNTIGGEYPAQR